MQQKLADYQEPAPELSWELIEQAVAADKRRRARLIPLWTRRIAAAAVVLLVASVGHQFFFDNQAETDALKKTPIFVANATNTKATSQQEKTASKTEKSTQETEKSILKTEKPTQKTGKTAQETEKSTQETEKPTKEAEKPTKEAEQPSATNSRYQPNPFIAQDYDFNKKTALTGSRLTAKMYLSNGMADKGTNTAVETPTHPSTTGPMIGPPGNNEELPKIYDNIYHRQPIRFGLSVNYCIADRWSIESGLVYTRLSSTYTYQPFDFFFVKADQRLTYIGIPLKVNHQLWAYRRFNVYASLGGMVEKMVDGKRRYDVHNDQPTVEESIKIKPLQFSVNGAVGAEYRFADYFSIYAEPELNYYFKNNSIDIPTFYQDRPLNFGFSIGLRMNLKR